MSSEYPQATDQHIHICWARGHYIGQVRKVGHRRWKTVTGKRRSAESALTAAASKMRDMKRARVLFIDSSGWYGPNVVMEAVRV